MGDEYIPPAVPDENAFVDDAERVRVRDNAVLVTDQDRALSNADSSGGVDGNRNPLKVDVINFGSDASVGAEESPELDRTTEAYDQMQDERKKATFLFLRTNLVVMMPDATPTGEIIRLVKCVLCSALVKPEDHFAHYTWHRRTNASITKE